MRLGGLKLSIDQSLKDNYHLGEEIIQNFRECMRRSMRPKREGKVKLT